MSTPRTGSSSTKRRGRRKNRAGQQRALQFAARQALQWLIQQMADANLRRRGSEPVLRGAFRQLQEPARSQRQSLLHMEMLRHVADGERRVPLHAAAVGEHKTQRDPHQHGLPGAVGADQRDDLLRRDRQMHMVQDLPAVEREMDVVEPQQPLGRRAAID